MSGTESDSYENQSPVPERPAELTPSQKVAEGISKVFVETITHNGEYEYLIIEQDVKTGSEKIIDESGPYRSKRDAQKAALALLSDNGIAATVR